MPNLEGRVAVVTGGAMGLGEAIARDLARCGAAVAIADLQYEAAQKTAADIVATEGRAAAFRHDVTSASSADRLVGDVEAALGPIGILVNNAGVSKQAPILELSEAEWDRVLDINLKGQFLTLRAILPGMVARDYGRIVNMSSVCGKRGAPAFAHYSASKFAVIGLTQSVAAELATTGITLNAVCPGIVATPLHDALVKDMAAASRSGFDETMRQFASLVPQGRPQTPEDVAHMVSYLASDYAKNMTGGSYHVDGGTVMQ